MLRSASTSRAPWTLRAIAARMCLQGISTAALGPEHARAVMEWEAQQGTAVLRVGATIAFAADALMVYALRAPRPSLAR